MDNVVIEAAPIKVNGKEIPAEAIASEMQYHPSSSRDGAYAKAARALVVRELLLLEARRLELSRSLDPAQDETADEAAIRLLIEREVTTPEADATVCRTYFEQNRDKFKTSSLIEASHILLPAPPDDVKARREARQQADAILAQLQKDPAAFEPLAKTHSACPSAKEGGRLGQLSHGQACEEFDRQVFCLPPGLARKPIETRYGYHIVRIDRRVEGQPLDYEHVKDKIAAYLSARVQRKALSQYIEFLIGEATIEGIDLTGADSPLMQ